jgi:hypothetical protein
MSYADLKHNGLTSPPCQLQPILLGDLVRYYSTLQIIEAKEQFFAIFENTVHTTTQCMSTYFRGEGKMVNEGKYRSHGCKHTAFL